MSGRGYGRYRWGRLPGFGGPSYCVCPKCGYNAPHVREGNAVLLLTVPSVE